MFLLLVNYIKPIHEVEKYFNEHQLFLEKYYKQQKFIFSGRRNPRIGGIILVNAQAKTEIEDIIKEDPFYIHSVAEYDVIEFSPTKYDERFACFIESSAI